MPYIPQQARAEITSGQRQAETAGELNFVLTEKAHRYLDDKWDRGERVGYDALNEVMGVFECAKTEFARTVLADYEDDKIATNGDL